MKRSLLLIMLVLMIMFQNNVVFSDEPTTQLNEVVVTATKTEQDLQDVTQSISVVTKDEIRKTGATDVATAIQDVTGVHISGYGTPGAVASLNIRGAYSSQILVLVNGIRMNSSRDGGFDLSLLPVSVDDIERIEVVRGPASALYGSDAVGGVINIITKKPTAQEVTIKGKAGSHGYDDLFLECSDHRGAWYYSLSGERETSDGYRLNSDLFQWIYGGRIGYDLSKTSNIEFTANYLANEVGSPGSTIYGETPHARQQERNAVFGASYKGTLTSSLNLKLSAYRKEDDLSYKDPDYIDFITLLPAPIVDRYKTTTAGGEAQLSWLVASWNQMTAGYELRRDLLDTYDAQAGLSAHSASLNGYYLQDEISLGEPLIIILGGRHDDHSIYGEKFSPKASARLLIKGTGTILRASYGKSFRAPTFNDLYFNSPSAVGNPNLLPESAKEYEAGIEQKVGEDVTLKLTGFDRKVKDLIQWDWTVFPMKVNNIGRVLIRGMESEATFHAGKRVSLSLNYTYTNPVDELTGDKIYYTIPQKQTKGTITIFPLKNVYLTLDGRSVENYVKPGEDPWRYSVMDAKVALRSGSESRSEVFFGMTNVFDRKYEAVQGYPMPPREIRGGISLKF